MVIAGLSFFSGGTDVKKPTTKKVAPQFEMLKAIASKWCRLFSVPLPLSLMIMHIESSFNTAVGTNTSTADVNKLGGAWGVGQVTVTTAAGKVAQIKASPSLMTNADVKNAIAKWTGQGPCLNDPDLNLLLSVYMLSGLWVKYKGDYRKAAAAYHSGSGTVDKLIAAGTPLDVGLGPAGRTYIARADSLWPTYQGYVA
jgi:soluble lytic murein transglycosylase-like protein